MFVLEIMTAYFSPGDGIIVLHVVCVDVRKLECQKKVI
jgi:hypothetical protein